MGLFDFFRRKTEEQIAYEEELNAFREMYLNFIKNDMNSFENVVNMSGVRDMTAKEFHMQNISFVKEIMESGVTGQEIIDNCPNLTSYVNSINYETEKNNFYSLYNTFMSADKRIADVSFSLIGLSNVTPDEFHQKNVEFVREIMQCKGLTADDIAKQCPVMKDYVQEIKSKELKFDLLSEAKAYAKKHPQAIRDFEPAYKNNIDVQLEAIKSDGTALNYCNLCKSNEKYVRIAMQTAPKAYCFASNEIRYKIGQQMENAARHLGLNMAYKLAEMNIEVKNITKTDGEYVARLSMDIPPLHNIELNVSAFNADKFAEDLKNQIDSLPIQNLESRIEEYAQPITTPSGKVLEGMDINVHDVAKNVYNKLQSFASEIVQFQNDIHNLEKDISDKDEPKKKKNNYERD